MTRFTTYAPFSVTDCASRSYRVSPPLQQLPFAGAVRDRWANTTCKAPTTARAVALLHFAAVGGHSEAQLALGLRCGSARLIVHTPVLSDKHLAGEGYLLHQTENVSLNTSKGPAMLSIFFLLPYCRCLKVSGRQWSTTRSGNGYLFPRMRCGGGPQRVSQSRETTDT